MLRFYPVISISETGWCLPPFRRRISSAAQKISRFGSWESGAIRCAMKGIAMQMGDSPRVHPDAVTGGRRGAVDPVALSPIPRIYERGDNCYRWKLRQADGQSHFLVNLLSNYSLIKILSRSISPNFPCKYLFCSRRRTNPPPAGEATSTSFISSHPSTCGQGHRYYLNLVSRLIQSSSFTSGLPARNGLPIEVSSGKNPRTHPTPLL